MALYNILKEVKKLDFGESKFIGQVVDVNDPLKLGRVRVRVPELHGTDIQIPDSDLPWCTKQDNHFLGKGSKNFSIPTIGTIVVIYFNKGDIYSPLYIGEIQSKANYDPEQAESYNNLILIKDTNGNKFKNDLLNNLLELLYKGVVNGTFSDSVTINLKDLTISSENSITESFISKSSAGTSESITLENDYSLKALSKTETLQSSSTTATSIDLTSPVINIIGNLNITGNLVVTGSLNVAALIINGKNYSTHIHSTPNGPSGPPL